MIFVDTWAWIALADQTDQYHATATKAHRQLLRQRRNYITSDFVLTEFINYLYSAAPVGHAEAAIDALFQQIDGGSIELAHVSPEQFRRAWELRRQYKDKPDISVTDFTSMIIMQDRSLAEIFTGDRHFLQVGLGFRLVP